MCSNPRQPFTALRASFRLDERLPAKCRRVAAAASIVLAAVAPVLRAASDAPSLDVRTAITRGDLDFTSPTTRSDEGMPVGNGRMGSLVWTTPSAVKFQINRCDVFSSDGSSVSFPRADVDYASGCGYIDINVASAGPDVFTNPGFNQHLALYDGAMTARGVGVTARVIAWNAHDVMAVEVEDRRERPEPINIDLRMLRSAIEYFTGMNWPLTSNHAVVYQTANHYATSQLHIRDGAILLTQRFAEKAFFDSSAIAISVIGRDSRPRFLNDCTVQLSVPPGPGKFTLLIASAATFDRQKDVGDLALQELGAAKAAGDYAALAAANAQWWHDFWAQGYVAMHSDDGQADFVGANYAYFLYLMASSSRGAYPPRFGGMLWYTTGDMRRWGAQYWHANTDAYYRDLMPAGHLELMDPFYGLYFGMYDACALAAQQQWASQGIYIPEVTFFNGPERIPDSLVAEFQDLFLARKPYAQASKEFLAYVQTKNCLTARYNFLNFGRYVNGVYVAPDKGAGIFGHCTHFLSGAAGVASLFWQRFEFTGDQAFLREKAYPIIKGVAEFYANFPNLKQEADGKYHIYHVNRIESDWDSQDTPSELGAMRTIFPLALRASQLLGLDEALRSKWQDIADHLASPAPGSGNRGNFDQTKGPYSHQVAAEVSAASGLPIPTSQLPKPSAPGSEVLPANAPVGRTRANGIFGNFVGRGDGAIEPLGSEPELKRRFLGFNMTGGFIDPSGDGGAQIFRNRLRLREGPGAIDAEHLGGLAFGIHQSLLTSTTNDTLTSSIIEVFPAWPKDWAVRFKLLARGGTHVTAAQQGGTISEVILEPTRTGTILLKNPWGTGPVTVSRGPTPETQTGETLTIAAEPGELIRITH
jgi:alpha-L-fucosidase 2